MTRLLIIGILFCGHISFGQKSDTSFGKPIFWYRVTDPWAMYMGASGPPFILYNTGNVLFWKSGKYRQTQLSDQEKEDLINELNLSDKFFKNTTFIDATNDDTSQMKIIITDQPSYIAYINFDTMVRVSVYGNLRSNEFRKRFPRQILDIHDFVLNFNDERAIDWTPDKIEVLLSDYSHSPDTPIQWPKGWPDLNSEDTKVTSGYVTSIFLNKKYFIKLTKLIKKRREKQAFEINGKKYFVGYRFPIPGLY
ncbi:MAG TPA: hypothetical protein PLP23_08495 [Panacibacter sp.]|nr:hypothetical protein [Panacibacter sp.]